MLRRAGGLALLLVALLPAAGRPAPAAPADCNIVLVFVDALRADHLGAYGYTRGTSPNIDRLARQGVVFENHFTPYTITIGSFMSMITGLHPDSHGVKYVAKDVLSEKVPTLAEVLHRGGYLTAWFGPKDDPHLDPAIGYGRGFDSVGIFPEDLQQDRILLERFLEENREKRFFLNFHTYKVHSPYFPSPVYRERMALGPTPPALIESAPDLKKASVFAVRNALQPGREPAVRKILGEELLGEIAARGLLDLPFPASQEALVDFLKGKQRFYKWHDVQNYVYQRTITCRDGENRMRVLGLLDAAILEFDTEVMGPLLEALERLDLSRRTIVIVAADHGDEFCEHGTTGHGLTAYDGEIKVPLVARFPWLEGGGRVEQLTMTVDLMPSLIDLVGLEIPATVQGRSLKGAITGQDPSPVRQAVMANYPPGLLTYRDREWKLVVDAKGNRLLFHLPADPEERVNVYVEHRALAEELEGKTKEWLASLPSYGIDRRWKPMIDEDTRKKIRDTGYW